MTVFARLTALLDDARVPYAVTRHAPVRTSEEAAKVRGTPLSSGAKALVCKADERFVLFVMPADRRLDSAAVRRALGIRSLRFATPEEVAQRTALAPGAIPPFGKNLLRLTAQAYGQRGTLDLRAGAVKTQCHQHRAEARSHPKIFHRQSISFHSGRGNLRHPEV